MSIEDRRAESDADLEAFIRIRRTLLPNESGGTAELFRAQMAKPERRFLVAALNGEVVGCGLVDRSDIGDDRFSVKVRVLRHARRNGVGTALLRELVEHASTFGPEKMSTHLEEEEARAFAERFGFRETDRQVEQVKRLGEEPTPPPAPDGIEIATIAERPSLLRDAHPLAVQGFHDMT
ncbi:MAG TPA: GNAT family N-acetyltransferase, partial [Gaiellaceae bacterium]|nr:GNAT family N-acetyltransferase [Gaiellaceae bacterium]